MRRVVPSLLATLTVALSIAVVVASPPASAASASLAGESLAGTDVVTGQCPPPGDAGSLPFSASGAASGPYPGTFTETGYWELDLEVLSAFHSSFTITSGLTTITGTTDFTTGPAFAACDGRAYAVPTHYTGTVTGPGGTSPVSGSSTVDISYGTFARTFAGGGVGGFAITTTSLLPATRGVPYSQQLQANGGNPPYAWKRTGKLPKGLTLSSSGLLSGTPNSTDATGNYSVNVRVTTTKAPGQPKQTVSQPFTLSLG
jgi:hypothetical protein